MLQKTPRKEVRKKVMLFGVFDGLHPGHRYLLTSAQKLGSLIVVVARDKNVKKLKNKLPKFNERERILHLKKELLGQKIILGDIREGSWSVIKKIKPDIIALGYDQKVLANILRIFIKENNLPTQIIKIKSHQPRKYHSRILHKHK